MTAAHSELHGSVTPEEKTFIETWENVGEGTNYVLQENRRGDEIQTGITGQGRRFRLSTYERMLTEERCLDPRNNPFQNGTFRPVIVPAHISIETNPNAMSEEDIMRLFVASEVAWDEYMKVIDAPATLRRMMELAEQADLSLRRYRQLETMHEEFTQIGKRIQLQGTSAKYQEQIDNMGGPGTPAPTVSGMGGARMRQAAPTAPAKAAPVKAAPAPAPAPAS